MATVNITDESFETTNGLPLKSAWNFPGSISLASCNPTITKSTSANSQTFDFFNRSVQKLEDKSVSFISKTICVIRIETRRRTPTRMLTDLRIHIMTEQLSPFPLNEKSLYQSQSTSPSKLRPDSSNENQNRNL